MSMFFRIPCDCCVHVYKRAPNSSSPENYQNPYSLFAWKVKRDFPFEIIYLKFTH